MNLEELKRMYDFSGRTVIITGGAGVLGSEMASALVGCRASVAIVDIDPVLGERVIKRLAPGPGQAIFVHGDVCKGESLQACAEEIIRAFGRIDGLINAAGGNNPRATTNETQSFFQLARDGLDFVVALNLMGTILPSQVFGKYMAEQKEGVILNVSSMTSFRPLTRVPAYSAAKAAVSNFSLYGTRVLTEYSR